MALADYKVTSNEQTVESQVAAARDGATGSACGRVCFLIVFTAAGLVALVGGRAGLLLSIRAESARSDPGWTTCRSRVRQGRNRDRCPPLRPPPRLSRRHAPLRAAGIPQISGSPGAWLPGTMRRPCHRQPCPRRAPRGRPAFGAGCRRLRADPGARDYCATSRPGYLLVRDAVSTPRSHLSDAALGLTAGRAARISTGFRDRR